MNYYLEQAEAETEANTAWVGDAAEASTALDLDSTSPLSLWGFGKGATGLQVPSLEQATKAMTEFSS